MAALNVGLNSTFDYQRQVINQLAIDVDNLKFPTSVGIGSTQPKQSLDVVGNITATGITTSLGGFVSGISTTAVQITVSGNSIIFSVLGVGTTTLTLF